MPWPPTALQCPGQIGGLLDDDIRRDLGSGGHQRRFLARPVLAEAQHGGRRTQRHAAFQRGSRLLGHVLEFQRHGVALCQPLQARRIGVGGLEMLGAQAGRGLRIGFQHHAAHAQPGGGQREHLRQLPAAPGCRG